MTTTDAYMLKKRHTVYAKSKKSVKSLDQIWPDKHFIIKSDSESLDAFQVYYSQSFFSNDIKISNYSLLLIFITIKISNKITFSETSFMKQLIFVYTVISK